MFRIVVLAALPEECRPLRRLIGPWRIFSRKPFRCLVARLLDRELILIETGMGAARACEALQWVFRLKRPDLVCSVGFAGGLLEGIRVGDVFIGTEFLAYEASSGLNRGESLHFEPSPELAGFCDENGVVRARVVSVDKARPKPYLSRLFDEAPTLVDMESYFAARFAARERIPFLCIRSVSDALTDEIDFDLDSITDSAGCVLVSKVLAAIVREPRLIKSFYHSFRRSDKAARKLGLVLSRLLTLPLPSIPPFSRLARQRPRVHSAAPPL